MQLHVLADSWRFSRVPWRDQIKRIVWIATNSFGHLQGRLNRFRDQEAWWTISPGRSRRTRQSHHREFQWNAAMRSIRSTGVQRLSNGTIWPNSPKNQKAASSRASLGRFIFGFRSLNLKNKRKIQGCRGRHCLQYYQCPRELWEGKVKFPYDEDRIDAWSSCDEFGDNFILPGWRESTCLRTRM